MILTGMGPALDIETLPVECRSPVKIFAGVYAIYSGVVFLAAIGLLLTPTIHRIFHKLHLVDWFFKQLNTCFNHRAAASEHYLF